jgi:hypothetical protein
VYISGSLHSASRFLARCSPPFGALSSPLQRRVSVSVRYQLLSCIHFRSCASGSLQFTCELGKWNCAETLLSSVSGLSQDISLVLQAIIQEVQVNLDIRVFEQCGFRLTRSQTFIPFLYMCPLKFRILRPIMKQKIFNNEKKVSRKLSPANSVARLCFCRAIMLP